MRTSVLHKVVK